MDAFEISQLIIEQQRSGKSYLEFLRAPSLSVGIYSLPAGGVDPQQPHTEDEVYYIVEGRGHIRVGNKDRIVEPGTVVFVAANVEHRFHTIREDMKILVFFAPAERIV
jgi:mannose-6-phosphate isomerase-like protein (cupin superfamily)